MSLDIVIEDPRWDEAGLTVLAEAAAGAALDHLGLRGYEAALMACDDARIATLNADFRGKAAPTNVLSWPSAERGAAKDGGPPLAPDDPELGDMALAYDTCAREATAAGKPFADHISHLVVHGLLHLLGYDHERPGDAALMEGLEIEILGKLGIGNPYTLE